MTRLDRYSARFKKHLKTSHSVPRSRGSARTRYRQRSIAESKDAIDVTAELPGVDEKDLDVTLANGMLTVRGEKRTERDEQDKEKNWHVVERSYGSFSRAIPLPSDPDAAKVEAKFDKGVLHIHLPKPLRWRRGSKRSRSKSAKADKRKPSSTLANYRLANAQAVRRIRLGRARDWRSALSWVMQQPGLSA
jgi:HSP20 family molecular chaperone IbpA